MVTFDKRFMTTPDLSLKPINTTTYHDLHITTRKLPRTALFNLPYGLMVTCTRVGGWELWQNNKLIAGEFDDEGLRLDVSGIVIVNSLNDGK